jgi:hypothetical protein
MVPAMDFQIAKWLLQDQREKGASYFGRCAFVELLNGFCKTKRRKSQTILVDDRLRLRDYSLLGGTVAQWQGLYNNTTPPTDFWVWATFSDAKVW